MAWLEITVNTAPENIETVAAALTAGGFSDLLIEDQAEFSDFLDQNRAYWDYIDEELEKKLQGLSRIKLYLEDTDKNGLSQLETLLAKLSLSPEIAALPETDWETSWQENYPPQPVGDRLVVLPYWLADTETNRLPIILDPGLTFGTGAHPSTQMVMEAMEKAALSGKTCLDLGSGSGILSITALRLGAKKAVGVDIDPKAEDIARTNAAYNGFEAPAFYACTGDVTANKTLMSKLSGGNYDFVFVNIVADVIIHLAPVLPRFLQSHSTLICSGILDVRLGDVTAALEAAGLCITEIKSKEDWRCVVAKAKL